MSKIIKCPRTFTDQNHKTKTIYCAKWTCEHCAPRKLRRLIASTINTAQQNAPLSLLTLRGNRLSFVWNHFTQRIRRPYIATIEHKPDEHIHAIIQKPPRDAQKIWSSLGGTYWHSEPVHEYSEALRYITKTLSNESSKSRLLRSRDWKAERLDETIKVLMDDIKPPGKPSEVPESGFRLSDTAPAGPGGSSTVEQIIDIIRRLPSGSVITFTMIKDESC